MIGIAWIATRLFFKKAWVWTKAYWYIPAVLAYTAVLWILFRRNTSAALEVLNASRESYKAQIKAIEATHAKEIAARDKAIEQYEVIIRALEEEYAATETFEEEVIESNDWDKYRPKVVVVEIPGIDFEEVMNHPVTGLFSGRL